MRRCARCRRVQPDGELTRATSISELYVCRNVTDCERAERCEICQRRFIMMEDVFDWLDAAGLDYNVGPTAAMQQLLQDKIDGKLPNAGDLLRDLIKPKED